MMGCRTLLWLAALCAVLSPMATAAAFAEPIRGITISCRRSGPGEWDDALQMARTMQAARDVGATWVTIHPYARIGNDGSVRFRPRVQEGMIRVAAEQAHAHGLRLLLKPHLAYWGSRFSWRGEISFDDPLQRERFFTQYTVWIADQARLAEKHNVDALAVGTELKLMLPYEVQWREVIKTVRDQYQGPLTYAANWDSYQQVPFWDALDAIGIQAYFPVSDRSPPTRASLEKGWQEVSRTLAAFKQKHNRPIVFTELGYTNSVKAGEEPWSYDQQGDREAAQRAKQLCLQVALQHIEADPVIEGAFLWKWFTEPYHSGSEFVLQRPEHRQIMRDAWRADEHVPREE